MKIRPTLSVVLLALASAPVFAQSSADKHLQAYRCAVLGDTSACLPAAELPAVRVEQRLELGPLAKYYVYQGMDREAAIERARAQGEHPMHRTVRVSRRELSSEERYERAMGRSVAPYVFEETLQLTVDRGAAARGG